MSIACATEFPHTTAVEENSKFTSEFEEYKRAQREKHQQKNSLIEKEKEEEKVVEEKVEEHQEEKKEERKDNGTLENEVGAASPIDPRTPLMAPTTANNGASSNGTGAPRLNSSVDGLRKSAGSERRNSLDKVFSFFSFKKESSSPKPVSAQDKEKARQEQAKREQDFRMAHLIAELEMSGKSDQEIQYHLFHIRDQSQFRTKRSGSVGEIFRNVGQAFKEEFSSRRELPTVHVATDSPFHAAPFPSDYAGDLAYSYEDLLRLESVPRGLKSTDHLPLLVYSGQELPSSQTSCAICMTEFEKEENLRSLSCAHYFHRECIDKWLSVGTTCPVCKGEVHNVDECKE